MRNDASIFLMIMKCGFVFPALCLLNHSVQLPSPHQETSELRFVVLSLPLFAEIFFFGVMYETVSIVALVGCHFKLVFSCSVFIILACYECGKKPTLYQGISW